MEKLLHKGRTPRFTDISKVILLTDMDGTLLNSKKEVSPADRAAIDRFTALGGKFTVATGRTVQAFRSYCDVLDLQMPVIMFNGATIYDYTKEELLFTEPLPEKCREMAAELIAFLPEAGGEVLTADTTYIFNDNEYEQLHTRICGITPVYADIADIPSGGWLKVLFAMCPENVPHMELMVERLGYRADVDFVRSADIFLEILPKGTSKGSALTEYRRLPGMEDFIFVSVGDFDNDIEMLRAADLGACPANAEESVKAAADLVLGRTNDEGAVAELIEYIISACGGNEQEG